MKKGDVVLIRFPFTDLTGSKNRPAVVLFDSEEDVTVCFITTNLNRKHEYDIPVIPSVLNGLKLDSCIRVNKLATIDKVLILGKLGTLEVSVIKQINGNLINLMQLKS